MKLTVTRRKAVIMTSGATCGREEEKHHHQGPDYNHGNEGLSDDNEGVCDECSRRRRRISAASYHSRYNNEEI